MEESSVRVKVEHYLNLNLIFCQTKSEITPKEAQVILQIEETRKKLCSTERTALQQKILITKLLLELHLTRVDQIQLEENETTASISKIREIINKIGDHRSTPFLQNRWFSSI